MNASIFSLIGSTFAVLASVATVVGAVYAVRIYRRQMNAQLFLAYTERYEAIMSGYPEEALGARFGSTTDLPPESPKLALSVLRYLNLSSEEFYLRRTGLLEKRVWEIWEVEIKRVLRSPLLLREWPKLAQEFESYPEFRDFVRATQAGAASTTPLVTTASK